MYDKLFIFFINNVSASCTFISLSSRLVKIFNFISLRKKKPEVIMLNNKLFI